jgi:predicted ATPase/DNA-binding SARP family transcriptional activator
MLQVTAFGIFRIERDGRERTRELPARFRRLLAHLALRAERVDRQSLARELWPDAGEHAAAANLRRHAHALVRAFAGLGIPDALERSPGTVALRPHVRALLDVCRHVDESSAGALSAASLRAFREPVFPGADDDWLAAARERLRATQADAFCAALEGASLRRDAALLTHSIEELLVLDPSREETLRRALTALAALGEPDRARRLIAHAMRRLREEFDAEPAAETSLLAQTLGRTAARNAALPLPPTPFFGRRDEVLRACEQLTRGRALTLAGPPGVGKSRIGWEAAAQAAPAFPDGILYLDCTLYDSAESLFAALADAAGAGSRRLDDLRAALRPRKLLIVLDNCERFTAQLAPVAFALLGAARACGILVTSRQPLRYEGELVLRVEPLGLPPAGLSDVRRLREAPAVGFFLERAAAAGTSLASGHEQLSGVAEIVRELDGLPLALELAALAVGQLGIAGLRSVVADRFVVLRSRTGSVDHQTTLEGAFDWSYALLDPAERELFRALGLVRGAWPLERIALYRGCNALELARPLARLAEVSLVHVDSRSGHFRTLRTTRDYMYAKLCAAGETERVEDRYVAAVSDPLIANNDELRGARAFEYFGELESGYDDVRAALESMLARGDGTRAARTLNALSRFLFERGHVFEALGWYDRALALVHGAPALRAETLYVRALLARNQLGFTQALAAFEAAIEELRAHGATATLAMALLYASNAARMAGAVGKAREFAQEARSEFARAGDPYREAFARTALGAAAYACGDLATAGAEFGAALEAFAASGARGDEALMLVNVGRCRFGAGDLPGGRSLFEAGLARALEAGNEYAESHARVSLALAALDVGNAEQARPHLLRAAVLALAGGDAELSLIAAEAAAELYAALHDVERASALLDAADAERAATSAARAPTERARYERARAVAAGSPPALHRAADTVRALLGDFVRAGAAAANSTQA